jgi:predicted secreted protein
MEEPVTPQQLLNNLDQNINDSTHVLERMKKESAKAEAEYQKSLSSTKVVAQQRRNKASARYLERLTAATTRNAQLAIRKLELVTSINFSLEYRNNEKRKFPQPSLRSLAAFVFVFVFAMAAGLYSLY